MSLIECVGVLAVVAILAAALIPVAIRQLDRLASDREIAILKALSDGLQSSILRNRYIPSQTDWASIIATETGMDIGSVASNSQRRLRVFQADSSGWLSSNLPYTQTYAGTPTYPANARVLLLSSLGPSLPLSSGMSSAADFANIWDTPPGTIPTASQWTSWNGRPDDLKIQRLNLSPLFVKLVLGTYTANSNGQYTIDTSALQQAPKNNGVDGYYLRGTLLGLYSGAPANTPDAKQILANDMSFAFEAGAWKGTIQGGVTFGLGDISGIVAAFLSAAPNTNAQFGILQQSNVVQSMISYMSNYDRWAAGSFSDNQLQKYLQDTVQPNLMNSVKGLYSGAYYPTNGAPCP